jgi:hypothetical protein
MVYLIEELGAKKWSWPPDPARILFALYSGYGLLFVGF